MSLLKKNTPGFRATCLWVGFLNILFFILAISKGISKTMSEFQIPSSIVHSPYYTDAMFWVFLHMCMIGGLIIVLGLSIDDEGKQKWASMVLVGIFCVYLALDIRTSDNQFGSALYKGPASMFPVVMDLLYVVLFLRISFALKRKAKIPA